MADGGIKRAGVGVGKKERKAVWISSRPTWEPTATKGYLDPETGKRRDATVVEMVRLGGALVRFEVSKDTARHSWAEHRRIGGADLRLLDDLEAAGRRHGADPSEWRVSYHDVPTAKFLSVEASTDGETWTVVSHEADGGVVLDTAFVARIEAVTRLAATMV